MTVATYDELVSEMGDWLNRSDLDSKIPTFIRLFEARMSRRLRSPQMELAYTFNSSASTAAYALPSDFRQARELYLTDDSGLVTALEPMSAANLRTFYPDSTSGKPSAYAVVGQNIVLAPVPDGSYALTLGYFRQLTGLDASNSTNWLLDTHPDLYLFGSLARAEAYVVNDERVAFWKSAEDEAMGEIMVEANAQRLPGGPLTIRPTVIE